MPDAHDPDTRTDATTPPLAPVRPVERRHHDRLFIDDYEWLRDKENPEVIAHLEAENTYTESRTAHLSQLREELYRDLDVRTVQTDLSVPSRSTHSGGDSWWYYSRTVEGQQYPLHCRVPAPDLTPPDTAGHPEGLPGEQVLLDQNLAAEGHDFFSLGSFAISPDGTRLAWASDVSGAERYTLRIRDLTTGEDLPDVVEDTFAGATWLGDGHVFFTRADDAWRPWQVWRHQVGTAADADVLVLSEPDDRFWVGVDTSRDERWLLVGMGSRVTSEYHLLSVDDVTGTPRVVAPRREGVEYSVEVAGDRLLILHNDGALDFELAEAPLDASSHEDWRTLIEHDPGVRLLEVEAYASHVVLGLRRDGLTGVHLIPRSTDGSLGSGADLSFDEPLYTVGASGSGDYDTTILRLSFTSLVTPPRVIDLDVSTGEQVVRKETPVRDHPEHGPYRSEDYRQVRTWATADDGTQIPISLVHHRDTPLDGSAPALLYGYGSYEISIDPTFSISRLSLLDRGFIWAIAHVRGGGELGRAWYENGKTLTKRNTFTDFIACADHLLAEGWTSRDRLAAEGGSAGGLLMGAVANLGGDRFAAIHAAVPFVDALTTILDPDLPLTVIEWDEWGDPLHDPEVYDYMASYSPYENVAEQPYPAILATTSLNDTRVYYVEPAKWVARLRATADCSAGVLLKTEMVAGHGGVSGRYEAWKERAFEAAWIIDQVGGVSAT